MANEFEMSMIGEFKLLGLQIKQLKNGIFVSQGKYIKDMIKKFGMSDSKVISTPMGTNGTWIVMQVEIWWIKSCIGLWLEAYSMWPHQGRMSCLVYACV